MREVFVFDFLFMNCYAGNDFLSRHVVHHGPFTNNTDKQKRLRKTWVSSAGSFLIFLLIVRQVSWMKKRV